MMRELDLNSRIFQGMNNLAAKIVGKPARDMVEIASLVNGFEVVDIHGLA